MATYHDNEERSQALEMPKISRNELREAAKLLPKLLLTTEEFEPEENSTSINSNNNNNDNNNCNDSQDVINKKELSCDERRSEHISDCKDNNLQETCLQSVSVTALEKTLLQSKCTDIKGRKNSLPISLSRKNSLTVPLNLSVFSTEIIPSTQHKSSKLYHSGSIVPEIPEHIITIPKQSPVHYPTTKDIKSTQISTNTTKESAVPKLPQITTYKGSQIPSQQPQQTLLQPVHKKQRSDYHRPHISINSDMSPSEINYTLSKSNVPLQLLNIRQQLQDPLETSTKALYPSMVGGWSHSRRKRIYSHPMTKGHPIRTHHLSLSPISNSILPYSIQSYSISPVQLERNESPIQKPCDSVTPATMLKPPPITFSYLKKSSRRQVVFKKVQNTEESKPFEDVVQAGPLPSTKTEENIDREEEEVEDKKYLVDFKRGEMDEKSKTIINKFRGGVINNLSNLTDEIHDDYDNFLNEVDTVTYYAQRQAEELLKDYSPRIAMLISSAVPKAQMLQSATKPEVLSLVYDVATETYPSLLNKFKTMLNSYMKGAKAKRLAVICKGGPGYMYLLQSKPITPPKLLKEESLLRFWKDIGSCMSKISLEDQSVVHLMECNVAGNRQGSELLRNLEAAMYGHKVKAESPLELEPKGREMIATYFYPEKFKTWKSRRYTKTILF